MVHIEVLGGEEQGLNANDGNMANANHIYVHHIDEEAPQEQAAPVPVQQQQQMAQIPMPMPMPMFPGYPGYNMYGYPGGGGGVIILNQEKEKEEKPFECPHCPKPLSEAEKALRDLRQQIKDEKAEKAKAAKEREKMMQQQAEEQKKRQAAAEAEYLASLPSKFAHSSIASVVLFILAFVFGTVAVTQTYDAFESTSEGRYIDLEGLLEDPIYITNRTYALAAGCGSTFSFTVASLLSFYTGLVHRNKRGRKEMSCCQSFSLVGGWLLFGVTFVFDMIIIVLAFDQENIIYPETVWAALIMNILTWMMMFAYSEMARRN
mmetsp:Transcript_7070/g.14944  ORF Transcript_7070/g.14944 Transcript_7070/m.14944 type:complete len:319 (-) Transcript_7070:161-1117(-)